MGAVCAAKSSKLVDCECPAGFIGDPKVACLQKQTNECKKDGDCSEGLACMDNACTDPCRELDPCDDPQVCIVVNRAAMATMVCKCPHNMVVSKEDLCTECKKC